MLGSAFVHLNDGRRSVLFSGDIGRPNDPVLRPPVQVPGADYLLVESTYGDRQHEASDRAGSSWRLSSTRRPPAAGSWSSQRSLSAERRA
jgi:Cft2 family RNA processing exonuclease